MCTRTAGSGWGRIQRRKRSARIRCSEKGNGQSKEERGERGRRGSMGKYMRKCKGAMGEEVAAMEATQAVGVRTRSKAAAAKVVVSKRRKQALLPAPSVTLPRAAGGRAEAAGGGSCYLKLRSRMLFMAPPPAPRAEAAGPGAAAGHGAVLAAGHGLSRCSSTASSVDAAAQDRSLLPCRSDAAKAGSDYIQEGSASNNSESGRDRERRETTPSSHRLPAGELSDLESDLAGQNRGQSPPAATTAAAQEAARPRMPAEAEIEEFFAAAEEAQAQRFASKYNFDIARGVPLDAGRYEWTPVVSSSS